MTASELSVHVELLDCECVGDECLTVEAATGLPGDWLPADMHVCLTDNQVTERAVVMGGGYTGRSGLMFVAFTISAAQMNPVSSSPTSNSASRCHHGNGKSTRMAVGESLSQGCHQYPLVSSSNKQTGLTPGLHHESTPEAWSRSAEFRPTMLR